MLRHLWTALVLVHFVPAVALGQLNPLAPAAAQAAPEAPAAGAAKSETKTWEFGVIITANGGPCAGLSGTIPVPQEWPEQQVKIVSEDVSPTVRAHSFREQEGLKQ